ncbi:DUF6082 family protein [Streptomyces sp. NPDC094031]|uniref:DUF6082 family protein n=1 Tax=Streptomyces sp. NPDC094031 TaxID=3155307 RepID=UPI003329E38D
MCPSLPPRPCRAWAPKLDRTKEPVIKIAAAAGVTLGTALGIAHLALTRKQHEETKRLFFVRQHSDLLRDSIGDPRFTELTNVDVLGELDPDTRVQYVHANRWVTLWSEMTRGNYLPFASFREVAADFMANPVNRGFWRLAGEHRQATARDEHDERFNRVMDAAYHRAHRAATA